MAEEKKRAPGGAEGPKKGMAESVLDGVAAYIPGLGKLIEAAKKSDVFKKRLEEVEKEVEARLKGGGTEGDFKPRKMGSIPPGVRGGQREVKRGAPSSVRPAPPPKPRVAPPDVFDEQDFVRVIATQIPDVEEADIKVALAENKLAIAAGDYKQEVTLPCSPKGELTKEHKKDSHILEIRINKSGS